MNPASPQADKSQAVISIQGLSFWYEKSLPPVVHEFSLDIMPKSCVALVGASGAGKTTLLRLISGLLTQEIARSPWAYPNAKVESNSIHVAKSDGSKPSFAYVPQLYHNSLLASATVRKNIRMGLNSKSSGLLNDPKMQETIQSLDLAKVLDAPISSLSGGQQQRVAICRALASRPHVLFLDEPFANLDFLLRDKLVGALRDLTKNCSIVLVSHDIRAAAAVSDRLVTITHQYGLPIYTKFNEPTNSLERIEGHLIGRPEQ